MRRPVAPTPAGDEFYAMDWGIRPIGSVPAVSKGGDNPDFKTLMFLIPERRLGLVVLMNTNYTFGLMFGDVRRQLVPLGVAELLLGQPVTIFPASSTPTLVLGILLLAVTVQTVGMTRTATLLRRWHGRPEQRPQGWTAVIVRIGLPLLCNVGWGLFALVGVPMIFHVPLSFLRYIAPDFGTTLLVSGVVALGWGVVRTAVLLWMRRTAERRTAVAIGTPLNA